MRKLLILAITLLFIIPIASAVSPVLQATDTGMYIQTNLPNTMKVMEDFELNVHPYNLSTGLPIDNATTNCSVHVYHTNGTHIISQDMGYNEDDGEFELLLTGTNFTYVGEYPVIITCQDGVSGGSVSGQLYATTTGTTLTTERAIIYIGLLMLSCFLFIISVYGIMALPSENDKDPEGTIIGITHLKYLRSALFGVSASLLFGILYLASNIAFAFLAEQLFGKLFFILYMIMGYFAIIMIVISAIKIIADLVNDHFIKKDILRGLNG